MTRNRATSFTSTSSFELEADDLPVIITKTHNHRRPSFVVPLSCTPNSKHIANKLVDEVSEGLHNGYRLQDVGEGTMGASYMKNESGRLAAVFKPQETLQRQSCIFSSNTDLTEDIKPKPGFRKGIAFNESSIREVAAFELDQDFCHIPETVLVKMSGSLFMNVEASEHGEGRERSSSMNSGVYYGNRKPSDKVGSLQRFVEHDATCEDFGASKFSVEDVHKIALFDIRVLNMDRHEGNILVKNAGGSSGDVKLIPIDHGLILPDFEAIEDEMMFCWLYWPQAKEKVSNNLKQYIAQLDVKQDVQELRAMNKSVKASHGISERSLVSLQIGTILLKKCILEKDLTLQDVGKIICGDSFDQKQSPLNLLIENAAQASGFHDPEGAEVDRLLVAFESELDLYVADHFSA